MNRADIISIMKAQDLTVLVTDSERMGHEYGIEHKRNAIEMEENDPENVFFEDPELRPEYTFDILKAMLLGTILTFLNESPSNDMQGMEHRTYRTPQEKALNPLIEEDYECDDIPF